MANATPKKTPKTKVPVNAGKNTGLKRSRKVPRFISILVFAIILPLASVVGVGAFLNKDISDSLNLNQASVLQEESIASEFSFAATEDEGSETSGEADRQATGNEGLVGKSSILIPNIPSSFCVPTDTKREEGKVIAVLDSQTLYVELDGEVVPVRYLGITPPLIGEKGGASAFDANLSLEGQDVILVSDGQEKNDDGELLRYVFSGEYFINFQLSEWGLASVSSEPDNFACEGFFLAAENTAKEQKIGLWAYVDVRMDPEEWESWPVIPLISDNAIAIYQAAIEAGRDPARFSIMGDCQSPEYLMFGHFEYQSFSMPHEYEYLQPTLDNYAGQWVRNSVTVHTGNTVASLFSPLWTDPERCDASENPIDCELRINNASVSLIMLGTNWGRGRDGEFDTSLRAAIAYLIDQNVLPILVTKADATNPDYPLNQIIVQVAYDYDIPLWNYWAALQGLEYGGMDPDDEMGIHTTIEAYPVKRWTGLQTLHAVREAVVEP